VTKSWLRFTPATRSAKVAIDCFSCVVLFGIQCQRREEISSKLYLDCLVGEEIIKPVVGSCVRFSLLPPVFACSATVNVFVSPLFSFLDCLLITSLHPVAEAVEAADYLKSEMQRLGCQSPQLHKYRPGFRPLLAHSFSPFHLFVVSLFAFFHRFPSFFSFSHCVWQICRQTYTAL
jgi:hypothetical protein